MYVAISQPPWMRQGFGSTDCSVIVKIDKSSVTNTCQLPISMSRICHRRERLSLLGLRTRRGEPAVSHCLAGSQLDVQIHRGAPSAVRCSESTRQATWNIL